MSDLRKLLLLLIAMTVLRCIYAVQMPMIAGEAYYWLWNWHPAAGYFDHPPMVAWVSLLLGGRILDSTLAARLQPIVLGFLSTLALFGFGRAMFPGGRVAFRAAALFAVTPIFDLSAMFLTPDNALVLFITLTWLTFWRAAERPGSLPRWTAAGVFAGLALLSKFHAWVLLPPLWMFLFVSPKHRAALRRPGPWLAVVVAIVVLSPNLIWNARHDWLNYAFQLERSDLPESRFEWGNVLAYLFGPLATLSPALYAAILIGLWRGWTRWRATGDSRRLFLLCAGLPLPLFLGLLTPLVTISPHWPAPAYGALIVLVVGLVEEGRIASWLPAPRFHRLAFGMAIPLTLLIHLAPVVGPRLPGGGIQKEKFFGWREIGELVNRHRDAMLADDPERDVVVMGHNWHLTSLLVFYSGLIDEGCPLNDEDLHNYRLWIEGRDGLRGASAVVVVEKDDPMEEHTRLRKKYDKYHRMLDPLFELVVEQPSLVVYEDGSTGEYYGVETDPPRLREFLIFRCKGFKGRFIEEEGE